MVFRPLIALIAATQVAGATPLEPLWQTQIACDREDPPEPVSWDRSLAWLDGRSVVGIDRASGKRGKPLVLSALRKPDPGQPRWQYAALVAATGDSLAVRDGDELMVFSATGAKRWRAARKPSRGMGQHVHAIDGGLFWIRGVYIGEDTTIERLALATGRTVWSTTAALPRYAWSGTDGKRLYVHTHVKASNPNNVITAFDVTTGEERWSKELVATPVDGGYRDAYASIDVHIAGDALVYVDATKVLHVLDAATGAWRADIPLPQGQHHSVIADATHAYLASDQTRFAVALAAQKIEWTQPRGLESLIALTPTALYVADDKVLKALDRKTGATLATYGMADTKVVFADSARAPAIIACDSNKRLIAFGAGSSAAATPSNP